MERPKRSRVHFSMLDGRPTDYPTAYYIPAETEAYMTELEATIEKRDETIKGLREALADFDEAISCTACGDDGFTTVDDGNGDPVRVECPWCHTIGNSLFNVRQKYAALEKEE